MLGDIWLLWRCECILCEAIKMMMRPTSNLRNRIISSVHRGSCRAVDEEGEVSLLLVFDDEFLQFCGNHLSSEKFEW